MTTATGLLLVLLCAPGCRTVGPDYQGTPPPPLTAAYVNAEEGQMEDNGKLLLAESGENPSVANTLFNDPALDVLIQLAWAENPSVHELAYRICESRSIVAVISGQRLPFADGNLSYGAAKRSSNLQPFAASNAEVFDFFTLGVASRWELDLFGRIRRETEAAMAGYHGSVEDLMDLQRILIADVARAYVDVRLNQELLRRSQFNLSLQRQSINLVRSRMEAGRVGRLDLVQLQTRIGLTEAEIPNFEQQLQQSLHRLAVLVGQVPNTELIAAIGDSPQLKTPLVAPGIPADLLRRRADIRRREREVAAASALIGVAESELYPRLSLTGDIALSSRQFTDLIEYDSLVLAIAPTFTWNILSLGRIESQVEIQKAQLQQAIARYRQTVLAAVGEVEDSLVAHEQSHERIEILTETLESARQAVELSTQQYQADRASLERVVSNQQRLLQASIELARARADRARAAIDLIQALGGSELPPATFCLPTPSRHTSVAGTRPKK